MRDKLQRQYQIDKEVSQNRYFEGEISTSEMIRLAEMLHKDNDNSGSTIKLRFEFVRSEYEIPEISGQVITNLALECQRCLKPVEVPMTIDFRLLIDASDELVQTSSLDTIYSDGGYIDIVETVEDELILGIPLVTLHDDESCNKHWQALETDSKAVVKENPFSVLQVLKTTD
jgi:uncharacterized protein